MPKNMAMDTVDRIEAGAWTHERGDHVGADQGGTVARLPMRVVTSRHTVYTRIVKPLFDRSAAIIVIVLVALPMLVVALLIAVLLGRPVLFRQRRVGRHGKTFDVLKFRTMRPDRRGNRMDVIHDRRYTHKTDKDPRHTRLGRFLRRYSIDELPQLFNVLRGQMSFVGPRPELEEIVVASYRPGLDQRHRVKPGLTGLWQISARGQGPMHENGEWDLDYVESISLATDVRIMLKTPFSMFGRNTGD